VRLYVTQDPDSSTSDVTFNVVNEFGIAINFSLFDDSGEQYLTKACNDVREREYKAQALYNVTSPSAFHRTGLANVSADWTSSDSDIFALGPNRSESYTSTDGEEVLITIVEGSDQAEISARFLTESNELHDSLELLIINWSDQGEPANTCFNVNDQPGPIRINHTLLPEDNDPIHGGSRFLFYEITNEGDQNWEIDNGSNFYPGSLPGDATI
jgi:hypothetical protein